MQARRFRADIDKSRGGGRIAILSTTWQTAALMAPQDHGYRGLHGGIAPALEGMPAATLPLIGGIGPKTYAAALALLTVLAIAMAGLLLRALFIGEFVGALFLLGFAALFTWQIGGFVRRNRRAATASTTCRASCCRSPRNEAQ